MEQTEKENFKFKIPLHKYAPKKFFFFKNEDIKLNP